MTTPSPDDVWFWDVLESAERNLRTLSRKLEALSRPELCRYFITYHELKDRVNPVHRAECQAALRHEAWSEDDADDFAAWVVSQGRAYHAEAAAHPEQLSQQIDLFSACEAGEAPAERRWDETVDRAEYQHYTRADYIAAAVFKSRFKGDIEEACADL